MALTDGLQAWWKFDETSGNFADSSGNNHTLTLNSVGYGAGKIGGCASLNDSGDYMVGDNNGLEHTTFSVTFWIKTQTGLEDHQIISKYYYSPARGWQIYMTSNGRIAVSIFNSGSEEAKFGGTTINDGSWRHVVVTVNGSNEICIFIDNQEDSNSPFSLSISPNYNSGNTPIYVGNYIYENSALIGDLDEVGIYNRILSSEEIALLWNNGNAISYPFTSYTYKGVLYIRKSGLWVPKPMNIYQNSYGARPVHAYYNGQWNLIQSF